MSNEAFVLLACAFGIAIGVVVSWFVLRSKITAAEVQVKADVAIELAKLHEQVKQVSVLDAKCSDLEKTIVIKQNDLTKITVQLAERTNVLESTEKRLHESASEVKASQIKSDNMQKEIQDATNKTASLTEQSSRVAGLERDLIQTQEKYQNMNTQYAELREQLGGKDAVVESLRKQISELSTEKYDIEQKHQEAIKTGHRSAEQVAELTAKLEAANNEINFVHSMQFEIKEMNKAIASLREKLGIAESALIEQRNQHLATIEEKTAISQKRDVLQAEQQELSNKVADLTAKLDAEQKQGLEKIALLNDAKEQLSDKFKTLANEILEEKSKRFTEQNQSNLGQLLEPLKNQLQEFKGKVEEVYVQEGKERSALAEQLKHMMSLNQQLSKDAHNLTRALKGDNKAQGNWGELILERVLDASGLRKGHEYDVQESHKHEDGGRFQPDVVIHLPEDKHLIIDSKVSIVAYNDYVAAESDAIRELSLKRHIESCKAHIKGLSDKNYQNIYGVKSLDFVLMFIPIEPAFMLAIAHDGELWQEAWKKNILLVSPSTLLFVVRTVAHLWRQEQQNNNAQEIAKRGAELYDKIAGFVSDMVTLGDRLAQAKDSYDKAYSKLSVGKGNVLRQAEMLKALGVKPTKQLPVSVVEQINDSIDTGLLLSNTEDITQP